MPGALLGQVRLTAKTRHGEDASDDASVWITGPDLVRSRLTEDTLVRREHPSIVLVCRALARVRFCPRRMMEKEAHGVFAETRVLLVNRMKACQSLSTTPAIP